MSITTLRDWSSNDDLLRPAHQVDIDRPLPLDSGEVLTSYRLNFETYGTLAPDRSNVVLVCHSLTKGAHAAGRHSVDDPAPGWWDAVIGPGKMLDTSRFFVVCIDTFGSGASSGPASLDPVTGKPYGLRFPVVSVRDMVAAQRQLFADLGIERLRAVIGGCFGGHQVLEWVIGHPEMVENAIVITTTPATSAHTIAILSVMRQLIRSDPAWRNGDYYGTAFPEKGLNAAVAAAIPLWMSRDAMAARFGRSTLPGRGYSYTLEDEFQVEAFISGLVRRARHDIDPNGLMYVMRAAEYFDLEREYASLDAAFAKVTARLLFISYSTDWRYPARETELMHQAALAAGGSSRHEVLDSRLGHGAFLFESGSVVPLITGFLDGRTSDA